MGALKTSEQGDSVAGEGVKDPTADERAVDTGAKIIIGPDPLPAAATPRVVPPRRSNRPSQAPLAPKSGLWLVVGLYVLSAAALAFALYERFVAN